MMKDEMERLAHHLHSLDTRLDVAEFTSHHFSDGLYIREMYLPKGTTLVGKEHLVENFFYLAAGKLTIWSDDGEVTIEAPWMGIVPRGAQRVGFAHEDSICFNTIPNPENETDIEKLDNKFFKTFPSFKESFDSAAITAAVAGVVSVGASLVSMNRAAKANKKAIKGSKERRKADLMQQFLKRREMLQQYRMQQATALAGGVASGADIESSGVQGVMSSLGSQAAYNVTTEANIIGKESAAFKYDMQSAKYAGQAAMWGTVADIAGSISGFFSGGAFSSAGGTQTTKPGYTASSFDTPSMIGDLNTTSGARNPLVGVDIKAGEAANINGGAFKTGGG